jgi:tetratricopeptide (TPR) repeat protein
LAYIHFRDYFKAIETLQQALAIIHEKSSPLEESGLKLDLSFLYHAMGDSQAAVDLAREAIDLAQKRKETSPANA